MNFHRGIVNITDADMRTCDFVSHATWDHVLAGFWAQIAIAALLVWAHDDYNDTLFSRGHMGATQEEFYHWFAAGQLAL